MRLFLRVIQCNGWSEHPNEKATPNRNGAFEYVPLFHCPIVHGRDSHQYQYDSIFCTKCDQFPFIWIESNFSLFHFGSFSFFLKKCRTQCLSISTLATVGSGKNGRLSKLFHCIGSDES